MTLLAARLGELFSILSVLAFAFGGVAIAKARKSGPGDGGERKCAVEGKSVAP